MVRMRYHYTRGTLSIRKRALHPEKMKECKNGTVWCHPKSDIEECFFPSPPILFVFPFCTYMYINRTNLFLSKAELYAVPICLTFWRLNMQIFELRKKIRQTIFVKNIFSFRCNQFHVLLFSTMAANWKFEATATFIMDNWTARTLRYIFL